MLNNKKTIWGILCLLHFCMVASVSGFLDFAFSISDRKVISTKANDINLAGPEDAPFVGSCYQLDHVTGIIITTNGNTSPDTLDLSDDNVVKGGISCFDSSGIMSDFSTEGDTNYMIYDYNDIENYLWFPQDSSISDLKYYYIDIDTGFALNLNQQIDISPVDSVMINIEFIDAKYFFIPVDSIKPSDVTPDSLPNDIQVVNKPSLNGFEIRRKNNRTLEILSDQSSVNFTIHGVKGHILSQGVLNQGANLININKGSGPVFVVIQGKTFYSF